MSWLAGNLLATVNTTFIHFPSSSARVWTVFFCANKVTTLSQVASLKALENAGSGAASHRVVEKSSQKWWKSEESIIQRDCLAAN